MKFELFIREEAHANILRNAVWWADHHSLSKAEEWMAEVYRQIDDLRIMPERHGLAREDSEFPSRFTRSWSVYGLVLPTGCSSVSSISESMC